MARTHARIKGSVWADHDWRALALHTQWAYVMLISQPHINNCGVLPYLPARWARLAHGLTVEGVEELVGELERHRFVVVDKDAGEVLIRSFIKHDGGVEKVPNVRISAERQYHEIESATIRYALAQEYPAVFTFTGPVPSIQAKIQGVSEGVTEPVDEGVSEPLLARVPSDFSLQTSTSSSARARADAEPDAAAAAAIKILREAGWSDAQIATANGDTQRALALLEQCQADPTSKKPGGLAWTKFKAGEQPAPQRSEVAPGAFGTRSVVPRHPHACPVCEDVTFKTEARLVEHLENVHAEGITGTAPPAELLKTLGVRLPEPDDEPEPAVGPAKPASA